MAFSCACCDDELPANTQIRRFDARYMHLDFPLTAIATIVANEPNSLIVNCEFRSNKDLVGLLWTSDDMWGHEVLKYNTDKDYSGVILGFVANPRNPYNFTVTFGSGNNSYVYRLFPYVVSDSMLVPKVTPEEAANIGHGPGTTFPVAQVFPNGLPTIPEGYDVYVIDFNDLRLGYNYGEGRVSPLNIDQLFFSITPAENGIGENATVAHVGELAYIDEVGFLVYDTGTLSHFQIKNANPNVRLSRGDRLQLSISQPGERIGEVDGKGGKDSTIYAVVSHIIDFEVTEWYWRNGVLFLKLPQGTLKNVAFAGGPAISKSLALDTAIGNVPLKFEMRGISVTGARANIPRRFYPQAAHNLQMTSGYDDTYNITPWRQVDNTYNLGYRGHFTIYMGMSHYFKARSYGGRDSFKLEVLRHDPKPLNYPTQVWCLDLFRQMQAYGYVFIWSTSYEILNQYCPEDWRQTDFLQRPSLSGWVPPSSFLIPTNLEAMGYLARVIVHGLTLLREAGIQRLMFQIGEPWWWDGSYTNGAPCIYDPHTTNLYTVETGRQVPLPKIENFMEPVTEAQRPYLEWLGVKLGQSTNYIRDYVKNAYPNSEATLLFFTPQIMNPASEMLTIINFPMSEWIYPNYDFVQIEDYDWIINGQLDLLPKTLEAAVERLKYPLEVVHYFVGFVNYDYQKWVWPSINIATRDAILNEIPNIYVWAYPQVIRDAILYDDTLLDDQVAHLPILPKLRQIPEISNVVNDALRPVFFVQLGPEVFLNSSDRNYTYDSKLWVSTGWLGSINILKESLQGVDGSWSMSLSNIEGVNIDEVSNYLRNALVKLYIGLTDGAGALLSDPKLVARGNIASSEVTFEGALISINVEVKSKTLRWSASENARYTDNYQQHIHPGDRGFKFISALQELKLNWGDRNA